MKTNQSQKNAPTDWQQVKLGDLGKIVTGNTPSMKEAKNYRDGIYCWTTAEDFKSKYIFNTRIKLSEIGKSYSRFLPKGSVLVTCIASIGKNAIAGVPLSTNQQINSIIVNKNNNNEFVYYLIENSANILKRFAGAGGMQILNKNDFSKIRFVIPPLPEQNRIVAVLETWDEAIEKLAKKIEIKEQIKKGLMQNLLTGKKRLKGFSGKWSEHRIRELIIKQDKTRRQSGHSLNKGKYPFFNNSSKNFNQYLNEYDFDGEMIIANTGGVAYFDYYFGKFAVMSDCFVFLSRQNTKFLFFKLKSLEKIINRVGFTGSGIKHLDKKYFLKLKIKIPLIKEQNAITQILVTVDQEIKTLKQKLHILKEQKRFLLNNLITGKIRTPETLTINQVK